MPDNPDILSRGEIQQRASKGALWTGLHAVVSLPLNVVGTVVIARVLDVAGYGQLAYLTVIFAVLGQVTDFGYTSSAMQWGSRARAMGDEQALHRHLSQVTGFHLVIQAPLAVVASLVILRSEGAAWAAAYAVITFIFLYLSCASLALVLDQRNDLMAKIAMGSNIVAQAAVIVAAVTSRDAVVVLVVRGAAGILPGLIAHVVVRPPLRVAALRPAIPFGTPPGYWRFSFYSWAAASTALLVFSRSEILLLEGMSTAEQTALFALAFGVSQQLTGPVDALIAPLVPATASLIAAHREHLTRAMQRAMSLCSLLAGLLMVAAVPALYALFPLLYGKQYASAAALVVVLGAMSTFQTATSVIGLLVEAQRQGRRLLMANLVALAVNLATALALIPTLGAWGALVANACGQLLSIALLARAAVSGPEGVDVGALLQGLRPWFAAVPGLIVATLSVHLLREPLTALGAALSAALIGVSVYGVLLRMSRSGPSSEDLASLTSSLPQRFQRPASVALSVLGAR